MPISMFETRTMLEAMKQGKPAQSFLRDRYFSNVRTFDTKKVDVDIVKGKRKLAPFVHPKIGGKTIEREGYTTNSYEAPEVSPDMVTTAEDMLNRSPGEPIYGAMSPQDRAAEQLGLDLAELDGTITRREESMCAEALFAGQVTVIGEGYNEVIRYWPTNPGDRPFELLGTGATWDTATANPMATLRAARRKIMQASGTTPRDALMGTDALEAFLARLEDAKMALDYRRVDLGQINPQQLPGGVTYWGYLKDSALDIYSYDEWYLNDSGDEVPMVPGNCVMIGSPLAATTMAYGVVSVFGEVDTPIEFYAERRVPDSYCQRKNPSGRIVQIKAKPLPIINQIDAFRVYQVLS